MACDGSALLNWLNAAGVKFGCSCLGACAWKLGAGRKTGADADRGASVPMFGL